jgi:hypothetical protein
MKSLLTLLANVITECGNICSANTTQDLKTVERRFGNEGLKFLTLTLPSFEEEFISILKRGWANPDSFPGFKKRGKTPIFLGGFLDLVIDRNSGAVRDIVSVEAIYAIRQITLLFKKIELECDDDVTEAAFGAYVNTDEEVREWSNSFLEFMTSLWGLANSLDLEDLHSRPFLRRYQMLLTHMKSSRSMDLVLLRIHASQTRSGILMSTQIG